MEKQSLDYSANLEAHAAAAYLEAIARGLRDGHLVVQSQEKSLDLRVGPEVDVSFSASSAPEKNRATIQLKLTWRTPRPSDKPAGSLLIGGGATDLSGDSSAF